MDFTQKFVGLLVGKCGTFVGAAFYLYEGSFSKITFVSKNKFRLSLWDLEWRGKKFDFWQYFVPTVVKISMSVSRTTIWFFLEQFLSSYPFWGPSKNCWDFLRKIFSTFVETAFYVYRQTIWRETIFSKEWSFSYPFMTYRGKQFDQEQPCLFTVDKTAFSISGAQFEILFQQFWKFSSILGFQYELLPSLAQKIRHSRQKSVLRLQTKIWQKIGFRLQSVTVFSNIWTLHKNLSDFWWESAARSSGLHSTRTRAHFEKITIVSKKHVSFIIMGLRVERKKFDFWQFFVRTVVKILMWVSRTTIWFFSEQFLSSYPFWVPSKNCWDFLRKIFDTFVETSFYVYRHTIWRESIFSKKISSSYLFTTWRGK